MDRWQTKPILLEGGLILNEDALAQGMNKPGSAIQAVNFEAGLDGGYRRISGYSKFDPAVVPGTGSLRGVIVGYDYVISARGTNVYRSTGSGWTLLSTDTRNGTGRYRSARYNWVSPTTVIVDGTNAPAKIQGTTYTVLANAPAGASFVAEYKSYLFFAKGSILTFSAPFDDTVYLASSGAGEINVGFEIVGIKAAQDSLVIFGRTAIKRLSGSTKADYKIEVITNNLGCMSSDSIQEVGGEIYFLSQDGIRTVSATDKIGGTELGTVTKPIQTKLTRLLSQYGGASFSSLVVREKSQYRIIAGRSSDDKAYAPGFLGCLRGSDSGIGWEWFELRGFHGNCADSGFLLDVEYVVHGGFDGYVYQQEVGNALDNQPLGAVLQTPHLPLDDPSIRKTIYKLTAYTALEGEANISVQTVLDLDADDIIQPPEVRLSGRGAISDTYDGTSLYDTAIYANNPSPILNANLMGSGMTVSFILSSYDTLPAYSVRSLTIQYALGGRR